PRVVDLKHDAGAGDGRVFAVKRVGDSKVVLLVGVVVLVFSHTAGSHRGHERVLDFAASRGFLQILDVALDCLVAAIGDGRYADQAHSGRDGAAHHRSPQVLLVVLGEVLHLWQAADWGRPDPIDAALHVVFTIPFRVDLSTRRLTV